MKHDGELCECGHSYYDHTSHQIDCDEDPADWGCCDCRGVYRCYKCKCKQYAADERRLTPDVP